jgi:hypothetical protein
MPEIRELAQEMRLAMDYSNPTALDKGEWHLPYVTSDEKSDPEISLATLVHVSIARCARISYRSFEGKSSMVGTDMLLANKLIGTQPLHASPAEHQATPDFERKQPHLWGNFDGWIQYRKMLGNEYVEDGLYDLNDARPADPSATKAGTLLTAAAREKSRR